MIMYVYWATLALIIGFSIGIAIERNETKFVAFIERGESKAYFKTSGEAFEFAKQGDRVNIKAGIPNRIGVKHRFSSREKWETYNPENGIPAIKGMKIVPNKYPGELGEGDG